MPVPRKVWLQKRSPRPAAFVRRFTIANDGDLQKAQQMAAHASMQTTKLYDRTDQEATLDEVEKIRL